MADFLTSRGAASRGLASLLALGLATGPVLAGTMAEVSALCSDRSLDGRAIRDTLETTGWQQAVVDRDGLYTDLATTMVLEITNDATPLADRFAQAPALAGNFERMVLSGVARIYQRDGALLFWTARDLPDGGEQVTCILGHPRDPETLSLMAENGGAEEEAATSRQLRRVLEDEGGGLRTMRVWARLTQEPSPTPLPDLFYMERRLPEG